jgi:16S rRNA (uracil1498-N3)-methyltransferase
VAGPPRFHAPGVSTLETPRLVEGAARHATSVLRLRPGDAVRVFDAGREFEATVLDLGRRDVSLARGAEVTPAAESPVLLHLVTSPLKGDLTEQVLRQTTELGVSRITIARFDHTDAIPPGTPVDGRLDRWRRVLVSAAEQSGRAVVPEIETADSLGAWLASVAPPSEDERRFVAVEPALRSGPGWAVAAEPRSTLPVRRATVVVGPAGGLTAAEAERLGAHQFSRLTFGARTLRAETACVILVAVLLDRVGREASPAD